MKENKTHTNCHLNPVLVLFIILSIIIPAIGCKQKTEYYTYTDFLTVPKTDIHLHINTTDPRYPELAARHNFSGSLRMLIQEFQLKSS